MNTATRIKRPVDPERIRPMPRQFAPLDRRLVYQQHLGRMKPEQVILYTFLACVSDAQGHVRQVDCGHDDRGVHSVQVSLPAGVLDRGAYPDGGPVHAVQHTLE